MSVSEQPRFVVRLRSRRVQRELDRLTEPDRRRILEVLHSLANDPRPVGCKKLFDDVYRVRAGDYRLLYLVDAHGRRVEVSAIRRRSERTYQGLENLFT